MIEIRRAAQADQDAIWEILQAVIVTGDTYAFAPDSDREKMLGYWCGQDKYTYVATVESKVLGTFILKDNQIDLGSHIANASYMAHPDSSGMGIGKTMGLFSLDEARRIGYKAMQFNLVIKSNERAVKLWEKLGFSIIGEIPEAFQHQSLGLTSAYIMYQKL